MLVLSRREAEKVLFPNLGISIEITRVQGSTVRLGIDAPKEIRIIRGELKNRPELCYDKRKTNAGEPDPRVNLQKCLDAANLAIHLAQNQLRQRLCDHAETALDQALECLEDLELAIANSQFDSRSTAAVRESSCGYQLAGKKPDRIAAVLSHDQHLRKLIAQALKNKGYEPVEFDKPWLLLNYLQHSEQPAIVVAGDPAPPSNSATPGKPGRFDIEDIAQTQLQIAGVDGLSRHTRTFSIDSILTKSSTQFTVWFASGELAYDFESSSEFVLV